MKIETLLRASEIAARAMERSHKLREFERQKRHLYAINKGIIRKFERLERENFKLRVALYGKDNLIPYECKIDPKYYGWTMLPFVYIKTDK